MCCTMIILNITITWTGKKTFFLKSSLAFRLIKSNRKLKLSKNQVCLKQHELAIIATTIMLVNINRYMIISNNPIYI